MTKPALMAPWKPYEGQKEALQKLSDERETTTAQLVREAVKSYLKRGGK